MGGWFIRGVVGSLWEGWVGGLWEGGMGSIPETWNDKNLYLKAASIYAAF